VDIGKRILNTFMSEVTARKKLRVSGIVQGVGFRPFIYRLALKHRLGGYVLNTSRDVEMEIEGHPDSLEAFLNDLISETPVLASLREVVAEDALPVGERDFSILESLEAGATAAVIPADVALCRDCAGEINDPQDRRYLYPFTNCTNCGPRFSIIKNVPYDRAQTTMAHFTMCDDCRKEYQDPLDRRFHAEPTACPVCGPHLWLEYQGQRFEAGAWETGVLAKAGELLRAGRILAVKGLGGFHLACDAGCEAAVALLRRRKGRQDKPLAVMVRDLEVAAQIAELTEADKKLLATPASPIVLVRQRPAAGLASGLAPGNKYLGLMLPYTPLHLLLLQHSPPVLVMTSGNRSEEPLAFTNEAARQNLKDLADAFVLHNRDIKVPCDDSVVRALPGNSPMILRRARGYVPIDVPLPLTCQEVILGVGAQDKNTFCIAWEETALLSQHIGDLDTVETLDYYRLAIEHFKELSQRQPDIAAHDLHPAYLSTRYAQELSGVRLMGVQHHHAHIASCLAENGRTEPCLGLAFDGTGYGPDGTIWGGEILLADLAAYRRLGHLAAVRLPGGDSAVRHPGKMALSYLHAAYGSKAFPKAEELGLEFSELEKQILARQLATGWHSPWTSSAGRLFDAVAATLNICRERTYEGQPALELEMAATDSEQGYYHLELGHDKDHVVVDTISLFRQVVEDYFQGTPVDRVAARFHESLARAGEQVCLDQRERSGLNLVALSGGVWQNVPLFTRCRQRLTQAGFEVLYHRQVPPNDGGIALGQAAVAAAVLSREQS
jgi:hydrogenase maturation protein HypF